MSIIKAKKFIHAIKIDGELKISNFKLIEEELNTTLKDGEILIEALFISIDAGLKAYIPAYVPVGELIIGHQVAKVLDSRHEKYLKGSIIYAATGWRTHTIFNPDLQTTVRPIYSYVLPDLGNYPKSLALGCVGMPGNTAYFGFLEICQPKSGETVVVSAAAGGIGIHVGQIAKIKGCRVIGITGSAEKTEWILKEIGFDVAINYNDPDWNKQLQAAAPNGIDCYFDNVGGEISSNIIDNMNTFGRISVCGAVSGYNMKNPPNVAQLQPVFITKQLRMEGFVVYRWANRWMEGINQNLEWINEGKLKYFEYVVDGFENAPKALCDVLTGSNMGKCVVKV